MYTLPSAITSPSKVWSTIISLKSPKHDEVFTSSKNTCKIFKQYSTNVRQVHIYKEYTPGTYDYCTRAQPDGNTLNF